MIEQIGKSLTFVGYFTASQTGATGRTVAVDVYSPDGTKIVTDTSVGTVVEIGGGLYNYTLASGSVTSAGNYCAVFKTASDTVDVKQVPAMWCVGEDWVQNVSHSLSDIDSEIDSLSIAVSGINIPNPDGPGSSPRSIRIVDEDDVPIVGAEVWVSDTSLPVNPSNPTNLVAGGKTTNDNGLVTYLLDPGTTVYVWCDHPRSNFENPKQWMVS